MESKFGKLNGNDLVKGFVVALITPVLVVLYDTLSGGSFDVDGKLLVTASLASGVAYLLKNFFSGEPEISLKSTTWNGTRPQDRDPKHKG